MYFINTNKTNVICLQKISDFNVDFDKPLCRPQSVVQTGKIQNSFLGNFYFYLVLFSFILNKKF